MEIGSVCSWQSKCRQFEMCDYILYVAIYLWARRKETIGKCLITGDIFLERKFILYYTHLMGSDGSFIFPFLIYKCFLSPCNNP